MSTYEVIGATVIPYSLTLTIPKYLFTQYSFSPSGDDIIENDVAGQALRPDPATPIMSAVVVNDLAAVA
jgi:hypothetical protein